MPSTDCSSGSSAYFEQEGHWTRDTDPLTMNLLRKALGAVPPGVDSLLDVGCGVGEFCKMASTKGFSTFGMEYSWAALQQARGFPRLKGCLPFLPFGDGSFDLVTAIDVIEHLPAAHYQASLAEMVRVSRNWVLLIVPHAEDLDYFRHHCPACGNDFHQNLHLRGITPESLCRDVWQAGGVAELMFFGDENWAYFDALGARARNRVIGVWPEWDLAVCPQCSAGKRGPLPAGTGSLLNGLELALYQEFQVHPGYWRRNRATEMGILFRKTGPAERRSRDGGTAVTGLKPKQQVEDPPEKPYSLPLSGDKRRLVLHTKESDDTGFPLDVGFTTWPRGLICCASDLQFLPRPINYSAFSYLFQENQQWGQVVQVGRRWARLFQADLDGGHACFVLTGNLFFDKGMAVEFFDDSHGSFAVELFDEGSSRYVPVGTVELTCGRVWKTSVFHPPRVLPGRWGYLCRLLPKSPDVRIPIASLGVVHSEAVSARPLLPGGNNTWYVDEIDYPSGLFDGEDLVAVVSERDLSLRAVTMEANGGPSLFLQAPLTWRCGTPLLLALGIFDTLPVILPDQEGHLSDRAILLALKGLVDQERSRRLRMEEKILLSLDSISNSLTELKGTSIGRTYAELRSALRVVASDLDRIKTPTTTMAKGLGSWISKWRSR